MTKSINNVQHRTPQSVSDKDKLRRNSRKNKCGKPHFTAFVSC